MELDFTKLNAISEKTTGDTRSPSEEPQRVKANKSIAEEKASPREASRTAYKEEKADGLALINLTREQEDHNRIAEAYKRYQDNIKRSGNLKSEILKGVKAGESVELLFLKAVECISRITGDSVFYNQIQQDLKSIYGEALLNEKPLELLLEETQGRLQRLLEALQRDLEPEDRQRVRDAVKAHEKRIESLKQLLDKARSAN